MKVYLKILCITAVAMLASCATMDRVSKTDAERVLHEFFRNVDFEVYNRCLLYTSPSPRDATLSRMPSSA